MLLLHSKYIFTRAGERTHNLILNQAFKMSFENGIALKISYEIIYIFGQDVNSNI